MKVVAACRELPPRDRFGLPDQLMRLALSVPSNLAEGWGRGTQADFARIVLIARGGLFEAETQLYIARDTGLLEGNTVEGLLNSAVRIGQMITKLLQRLENRNREST